MRTGLRNWNWNCKVDGQLGDHCWFLEDEVVLRGVAVRSLDCYGGSLVAGLSVLCAVRQAGYELAGLRGNTARLATVLSLSRLRLYSEKPVAYSKTRELN